jgi:zinc protease
MRALALAVVLAVLAFTIPDRAAATGSVARERLANGLRVVVREDARVALVAVSLQASGGSGHDAATEAGLANLMQRAMARGAGELTAEDLGHATEGIGGGIEALADLDHTEIRASALALNWERLLGLVAEVALAPTFAPAEVERERRLVTAQLRTRSDAPFLRAFDALVGRLFPGHPYASPAPGRIETVATLAADRLRAHHAASYRPDRMVLAVSGRVDSRKVVRAASRLFGRLAAVPPAPAATPEIRAPEDGRQVIEHAAQQAQVLVGYQVPGLGHPDYPPLRVLGAVLGSGMAARLFVSLRDTMGLAYAVGVLAPFRVGPGYLVAHAGTAPDSAAAAEQKLLAELERMRAEGPTDSEVERARSYLLGGLALDRLTNSRHAWYLAFGELHGLGADFPDGYARALAGVTTAHVRNAAARYLVKPSVVTLVPR